MTQQLRPHGIMTVTRTINRVVVVEKPPPNRTPGCWKGGCGCLVMLGFVLLLLGGINSCSDGELWSSPAPVGGASTEMRFTQGHGE